MMESSSKSDEKCSLCFQLLNRTVESNSNDLISEQLMIYRYHQNVRDTHAAGVAKEVEAGGLPQLTFALSVRGSQKISTEGDGGSDTETVNRKLCDVCYVELQDICKLHKELEGVKNKIGTKMGAINSRRQKGGGSVVNTDLLSRSAPNLQMSLGASVVGKDNILQTLKYLTGICDGLTNTQEPFKDTSLEDGVETVMPPELQIGVRPFVCEVCFNGHYVSSDLKRHRLVVHKLE